ncbi:MAG: HAMP domain-containing sensor histidine kinase, partial [Bacteroidales bacterium]
ITLSQRITSPDVKLVCEIPSEHYTVESDKNRFTQVVTNFATNAIKFTPKGEIKIGYQYTDGGIKVFVTDTGIGIAAEKIDKVFERFEKLDDFAQGSGLGMAICKAIMDACNGQIGLESELGKGSTFWAWFPES